MLSVTHCGEELKQACTREARHCLNQIIATVQALACAYVYPWRITASVADEEYCKNFREIKAVVGAFLMILTHRHAVPCAPQTYPVDSGKMNLVNLQEAETSYTLFKGQTRVGCLLHTILSMSFPDILALTIDIA